MPDLVLLLCRRPVFEGVLRRAVEREPGDRVHPCAAAALPAGDLVHGDFGPQNVLVDGGRIAAVIDLEAAGCGTRA
jgi:Ser/Thr protein kinase RdoA (MazF antagonist)